MQLNKPYRIFAVFMALLMFTSSVGLSMDIHYCQGHLSSVSLIGKAKNCHEMSKGAMINCSNHPKAVKNDSDETMDENQCCSNKFLQFQSDEDLQPATVHNLVVDQFQGFIIAYVSAFFISDPNAESTKITTVNYQPPLISRDILALFESFLL